MEQYFGEEDIIIQLRLMAKVIQVVHRRLPHYVFHSGYVVDNDRV